MDALVEKRIHMETEEVAAFSDCNVMKLLEVELKSPDKELKQYFPSIPEKWTPDLKKDNEPEFSVVDNPSKWNRYIFRPEFEFQKQGGRYKGQLVPHRFHWDWMESRDPSIIGTFFIMDVRKKFSAMAQQPVRINTKRKRFQNDIVKYEKQLVKNLIPIIKFLEKYRLDSSESHHADWVRSFIPELQAKGDSNDTSISKWCECTNMKASMDFAGNADLLGGL